MKPKIYYKLLEFVPDGLTRYIENCPAHGNGVVYLKIEGNKFACTECEKYSNDYEEACKMIKNLKNLSLEEALLPKGKYE